MGCLEMVSPELRIAARTNFRRKVVRTGALAAGGTAIAEVAIDLLSQHGANRSSLHHASPAARAALIAVPLIVIVGMIVLGVVGVRRSWFQPSALWALAPADRRAAWKSAQRGEPLAQHVQPMVVEQALVVRRIGNIAWVFLVLAAGTLALGLFSLFAGHPDAFEFLFTGTFGAAVLLMRRQAAVARRIQAQYGS